MREKQSKFPSSHQGSTQAPEAHAEAGQDTEPGKNAEPDAEPWSHTESGPDVEPDVSQDTGARYRV